MLTPDNLRVPTHVAAEDAWTISVSLGQRRCPRAAGLTPVGAATILAETDDLTRFRSARAVVKHAGPCPRDNSSGQHPAKSTVSGRSRPALRLAACRAVGAALPSNPCPRHGSSLHLTTRDHNRLAR
jgi:transposase